jgi:hypothetical protein
VKCLDRDLYLVISELNSVDGPIILEVELDDMDIVTVTKDILTGQYSQVAAVIQINVDEKICRDVTHDFQTAIDDYREAVALARRGR